MSQRQQPTGQVLPKPREMPGRKPLTSGEEFAFRRAQQKANQRIARDKNDPAAQSRFQELQSKPTGQGVKPLSKESPQKIPKTQEQELNSIASKLAKGQKQEGMKELGQFLNRSRAQFDKDMKKFDAEIEKGFSNIKKLDKNMDKNLAALQRGMANRRAAREAEAKGLTQKVLDLVRRFIPELGF